ncbi:MAG: hydantoinase B/oxoprolinase family protein [Phycisphaerales bacterium JB054]
MPTDARTTTHEQINQPRWRVCVDTGGTFTDCLATAPDGTLHRGKVLSTGAVRATIREMPSPTRLVLEGGWLARPAFALGAMLSPTDPPGTGADGVRIVRAACVGAGLGEVELASGCAGLAVSATVEVSTGEEAPVLAARLVTGTPAGERLPPMHLRLATTRGTNALLERRGGPVAFFVTEGFADLLVIGDQTRPDLFTLRVERPAPLHECVVEVRERLDAKGAALRALEEESLRKDARRVLASGVRIAAVALAHAWREPAHEQRVRDILLEEGFDHVSVSSELGSAIGLLARAETAVVNAFLSPVIDRYLDGVAAPLDARSSMVVMTSGGGLVERDSFEPKDSLLSGPAGGVVGAAAAGRAAGCKRVVSFDMGGTSTDCARCEGAPERVYQTRVGDARIVSPSVAVETVAAGGGSVCRVEHGELRVGPQSAGAEPGPACYGRGGPLTITDCNLLLGRVDVSRFAVPLDADAARGQAEAVLADASAQGIGRLTLDLLLAGFVDLANQRMAEAIRRITVRRGHDPADHALVAFGGAGPQHACAIADLLGMPRAIVPQDAGLLSAVGLGVAGLERTRDVQVLRPLADAADSLDGTLTELEATARADLHADRSADGIAPQVSRTVELRFVGQDDSIEIAAEDADALRAVAARFASRYRTVFGYLPSDTSIEVVSARVTVRLADTEQTTFDQHAPTTDERRESRTAGGTRAHRVYAGSWTEASSVERDALRPGQTVEGPALLTEAHSTVFVEPGWAASVDGTGSIVLTRRAPAPEDSAAHTNAAPAVEAALAAGKLTAIAEEMGERLCRAAVSTNVKQRRDFSCAILDAEGRLVVNAPHVPVHLGSMGVCVRAVRELLGPDLGHGTIVTNHPAFGGSHLPDVTVIHPVHDAKGRLLGYAAARAHHAEIGGIAPGSMAPEASTLAEEGVVIRPVRLGRMHGVDWDEARTLFGTGPYPSRDPATNARDLAAAAHAVWAGADALRTLGESMGPDAFAGLSEVIRRRAAERAREAILAIPDGVYRHTEPVRGGGPIVVSITIAGDRATVDFAGTGPVHARCLNATPAIVTSAVVYVLRVLVGEDLPLNEGLLEPVTLHIPPGMLSPEFSEDAATSPAVAGGNVEISQLLVESMLTALGRCAQSQGTMNNVVFGTDSFGVYETLGGGCGAGPGFAGASAVHSHMTNTALTDVEVIEQRFPVRIQRCEIRRGSGGAGKWRGGDGLVRVYQFLEPVRVGVLWGRARAAQGLCGGAAGEKAVAILGSGSAAETSGHAETVSVPRLGTLRVETPGGGGYWCVI